MSTLCTKLWPTVSAAHVVIRRCSEIVKHRNNSWQQMQPILVSDQRCVSVDGWAVGSGRVDTRWFCSGGRGGGGI